MNREQFGEMCEKRRKAVLSYAFACCRDLNLAEDIVQETLVIAFEKREHYFSNADFGAWLISIARNVWFRERGRRKLQTVSLEFIEDNAMLLFEPEVYAKDRWERERRHLSGCLRKLNEADRSIINAHFTEGLKYVEIGKKLNQSLSWVKVRMHRARLSLKKCVQSGMKKEQTSAA